MVHYPGLKKADYRLAKVSKVMPDDKGIVRTMEVLMRPRDKRTYGSRRYIHKDLEPMTVPVQRTALLMPSSEAHPTQSHLTTASTHLQWSSPVAIKRIESSPVAIPSTSPKQKYSGHNKPQSTHKDLLHPVPTTQLDHHR